MRMASAQSRDWRSSVDDVRAAYDEAPYEWYAHPQSAPGQLAAIAWAFGLTHPRWPALGCSRSVVLLRATCSRLRRHIHARARWDRPVAGPYVDLGRRRVRALGLDNVELLHGDIA